jgi:predicted metal-binding transcription factor (methanogenesis marker protein 9)
MDMSKYDFNELAKQIAKTLLAAANDHVVEAENLRDSVKVLVEGIEAQAAEHAKMLNEMDDRLHVFGASVLEAHKKFLNGKGATP